MHFYVCRRPWGAQDASILRVPPPLGNWMYTFLRLLPTLESWIFTCAAAPGELDVLVCIFTCAADPGELHFYVCRRPWRA
jgi:hypothetical protein